MSTFTKMFNLFILVMGIIFSANVLAETPNEVGQPCCADVSSSYSKAFMPGTIGLTPDNKKSCAASGYFRDTYTPGDC